MKMFLDFVCMLSLLMIGLSTVSTQQKYRDQPYTDWNCKRLESSLYSSHAIVYYSYYYCNNASIYKIPDRNFTPRSTFVFIGTPGTSASGYYEYLSVTRNLLTYEYSTLLQNFDLVFIDMPGVGFSTITNSTYLNLMPIYIAADLANLIVGVFNENPRIYDQYFYLYAESIGSKILPEVALDLYDALPQNFRDRFQGIFLGAPFISPIDQVIWSSRLYQQGFIDKHQRNQIAEIEGEIKVNIVNNNYREATRLFKTYEESVHTMTGGINKCDVSTPVCRNDVEGRSLARQMKELRSLIDCEESTWNIQLQKIMNARKPNYFNGSWGGRELEVIKFLGPDLMVSVSNLVEQILNNTNLNVFIITGQEDLVSGPAPVGAALDYLSWNEKKYFSRAPHEIIRYGGQFITRETCKDIIGYKQRYGQLSVFTLRKTGHRIFYDTNENPLRKLESVFLLATGLQIVPGLL